MYINMYIYAHILMYIYVEIDVYMGGVDGDVCMYAKIRSLLLRRKTFFFFYIYAVITWERSQRKLCQPLLRRC